MSIGPDPAGARRIADNMIRDAIERGEFDNLEGKGKPIPDIDEPYDPMWWVKKKIAAEHMRVTRTDAEAILGMNERDERKRRRRDLP